MTEIYKSIREFAQLANVSTDTVYRLIRKGDIKQDGAGRISLKYLQEFQSKAILEIIARGNINSQLFVAVNAPDELELSVAEVKNNANEGIKRFDSIDALLGAYQQEQISCVEEELERVQVMYREHILREFITRYRNAAKYEIDKLYNHEVAGNYPLRVLYELALYDKLYSDSSIKMEELNTGVVSHLNDKLSEAFKRILNSLNLYTSDKQPVFTRETLTPEIVFALEEMNFREERSKIIADMTALDFTFREATDSEKVWNSISTKYMSTIKSKVAHKLLKNGFYSIVNFRNSTTEDCILKLSEAIHQGYYREVCILMKEDEFKQSCFPLYLALKTATDAAHVKLLFAN